LRKFAERFALWAAERLQSVVERSGWGSEKETSEAEERLVREIGRWSEEREPLPLCLLPPSAPRRRVDATQMASTLRLNCLCN